MDQPNQPEIAAVGPDTSDGFHTFSELYAHRHALVLTILDLMDSSLTWWSAAHHPEDDPIYEGYVIVGMETEHGPVTYHLPERYAAYLKTMELRELEHSPEWDGHSSDDVIDRLIKSLRYVPKRHATVMEPHPGDVAHSTFCGDVTPAEAAQILAALNGQGNPELDQREHRAGLISNGPQLEMESRVSTDEVDAIYAQRDALALMVLHLAPRTWFQWHSKDNAGERFFNVGLFVPTSDDTLDQVQFLLTEEARSFLPLRTKALRRAPAGYPIGDGVLVQSLIDAAVVMRAQEQAERWWEGEAQPQGAQPQRVGFPEDAEGQEAATAQEAA